jgi:hypothetical protein
MLTQRVIGALALTLGLSIQTPAFAQLASSAKNDPEVAARKAWRSNIAKTPVSARGCFHAAYPNFTWENLPCKLARPIIHSASVASTGSAPGSVGNGNDYVAQAQGLISYAVGQLELTDVTSETGVGGIAGSNEYMLQINTNNDRSTPACTGHIGCRAWQQFFYATDYDTANHDTQSAVFIQYWLLSFNDQCPDSWYTSYNQSGGVDCYKNSSYVPVPHIPVTELGDVAFSASVTPGGDDIVQLVDGSDAYVMTADDSVLDISSVWYQAEFNVVGDADDAQADFNLGASIQVVLQLADGSSSAPVCMPGAGTTGETNNLTAGACQSFVLFGPAITFTESSSVLRYSPIRPVHPIGFSPVMGTQSSASMPVLSATTTGGASLSK